MDMDVAVLLLVFAVLSANPNAVLGLRCYVCNSRADPRCMDPFTPAQGQDGDNSDAESGEDGLRPVDCEVAGSVRKAMDAVSSILSRLGQRPPGGGDVWADVREAASKPSSSSSSQSWQTGSGSGNSGGGRKGQRGQGGQSSQGSQSDVARAACHKVDREVNGELVTDRGCAPERISGQEPCDAVSAYLGEADFCELCDEDGCNGSRTITPPGTLVALTTAILAQTLAIVGVQGL